MRPRRRRRPRVKVIDDRLLLGHWGFAPAGEGPGSARGRLTLEPTGLARWQAPRGVRAPVRGGRWRVDGARLIVAIDGGAAFAGPVVTMNARFLWGRGVWVRVPRELRTMPTRRARNRAVGTRVRPAPSSAPLVALAASAATVLLVASALMPSF